MELFRITLIQIIELFLLLPIGFALYKKNIIGETGRTAMTSIIMNVCVPAIFLSSFQDSRLYDDSSIIISGILLSVFTEFVLVILGILFIRKSTKYDYKIERLAVSFSNVGFIGIPLLTSLFPQGGSLYASIFYIVHNLFLFTYGVVLLSDKPSIKDSFKSLATPTMFVMIIAVLLFVCRIQLPTIIMTPIGYCAQMNTPLSMICTGATLAHYNLVKMITRRTIYISSVRMIWLPLLVLLLFRILRMNGEASLAYATLAMTPSPLIVSMMAKQYGHDEAEAISVFMFTTIICIVTIPLLQLLQP